ncbi:MAG: pyrroloquinoline quinone biosynthesis protein PqqE, partial [Bradyrhizobium sp.]|nr:pyrroloquinoline quinone biosynthesis protein PqqE [Bradyrhizobium sp.]
FGGCRCQAFALTGDAGNTDPACSFSPLHEAIFHQAEQDAASGQNLLLYRNFAGGTLETESNHGA